MRPALLIFSVAFLCFFVAVQATPNGWGEDTQLTFTSQNSRNPSAYSESDGVLHYVWVEDVNGLSQIVYGKRDGDQTPVSSLIISDNSGNDTLPEIVVDTDGNAHVVWMNQGGSGIKYRKINSIGQIDGPVITIISGQTALYPSLDIDSNNNLHLAWQGSNNGYQIYYIKLDSFVNTILGPIQLTSSTTGQSQWPDLKVNVAGEPNLVWTYFNDTSLIYTRLSTDGDVLVQTGVGLTGSFYNFRDPQIVIDNNAIVHIAYDHFHDSGPGQQFHSTSYKRVTQSGSVLIDFQNLNSGMLPNIVVDSLLNAYIVSQSFVSGSGQQIKYAKFPSTGTPVITDLRLTFTGGESIEPFIVMQEKKLAVIWSDDSSGGNWEIFLKKNNPLPVLLVHGIYSDDSIWEEGGIDSIETKLEMAGYSPFKVGAVNGLVGLVPNNGDIGLLENQLRNAIQTIKEQTDTKKVSIVAHSMGGLVARSYIDSHDYAQDINNLIMLGTPNEGAPIAQHPYGYILNLLQDDELVDSLDTGRLQMRPGLFFLTNLNLGYASKNVNHFGVAGTSLPTGLFGLVKKLLICTMQPDYCNPKNNPAIVTDSIVPVESVDFTGSCVLDNNVTHTGALGPAYYDTLSTYNEIMRRLKGESSPLDECDTLAPLSVGIDTEVFDIEGAITTNSNQQVQNNFPVQGQFSAVLHWPSNNSLQLYLELPNGTVIHSGNYTTVPGTTYEKLLDANGSVEWFTFTQPPSGNWDVNVQAGSFSGTQDYNVTLFAQRSVFMSGNISPQTITPGQSVIISGTLIDVNGPFTGGTILAHIQADANRASLQTLDLFDDGNHSDGSANDGVYADIFTASSAGSYIAEMVATGTDNQSVSFTLTRFDSFEAKTYPDLMLTNADINFGYDSSHAPTPHSIQVQVSNIGNAAVSDANIDFYLEDPFTGGTKIGTATISLNFNQSGWTPKIYWKAPLGDHNIFAFPSSSNSFLDANYDNEVGKKMLSICGVQVYGGSGGGGRCFPIN